DFLEDLASLVEPLWQLCRKNARFKWNYACQKSFDTLKKLVQDKLNVFIFDPNCATFLTTDASDVGLGAVLSQLQNGKEVPISFASHTLSPRERNFATNEREALACVWGCEHFEKFLLGRPFTLRTDHAALTTLLQRSGSSRQSAKFERWFERLSIFDYTPLYTKGTNNTVADWLSRLENKA
ncbi:MAG: hypothetical protein GY820_20880, partial [Gammaproteobacteria bacterium]|nr:hypothetical protein [Gammaproteobacteria bacterium]